MKKSGDDNELVLIADYWFQVEHECGLVYLNPVNREVCSCVGMGEDLEAAKRDVKITATTFLQELGPEDMTQDLIDFCLDVYTDPTNANGECTCSACRSERGEFDDTAQQN